MTSQLKKLFFSGLFILALFISSTLAASYHNNACGNSCNNGCFSNCGNSCYNGSCNSCGNSCCCCGSFTGFYVGASIGYDSSVSSYKLNIPVINEQGRNDFGLEGVDGGIHIGFGASVLRGNRNANFYVGIEAAGILIGAKGTDDFIRLNPSTGTPREETTQTSVSNSVELTVRLGVPIYNVAMPYIKFGGTCAHWKIRHVVSPDLMAIGFINRERSRNLNGYLLAVGTDILLDNGVILGLEIEHAIYKKQTIHIAPPAVDRLAVVVFQPRFTRGAFRLSYLF